MATRIPLRTTAEIAQSRAAGQLAADVLAMIGPYVQPGVSTEELDRRCHDYIVNTLQATPANVGYYGFPKTLCISVNDVVCHGIPGSQRLQDGDIVNIDVAVIKDGWYGDTSRMFVAGQASREAQLLIDATYQAMCAGIRAVRPGATLGDVGHAIARVAEHYDLAVVRDYCGHGIGTQYHTDPQVLHYGRPGQGLALREGMIFTIEPMLNAGRALVRTLDDGWTVVTRDHSWSAQWEHMVAVTEDGYDVLTRWPDGTGSYEAI